MPSLQQGIDNPFNTPPEPIVPTDVPLTPATPEPSPPEPTPEPFLPTDVPLPAPQPPEPEPGER